MKPSRQVRGDEPVEVLGDARPYVSRAGEKLAAALQHFEVEVEGKRALDAGASTGGFTDCLLQNGARTVAAVDVGYGQLHEKVRADRRVAVHERTNVRDLAPGDLGEPFELVVADLSFISLALVLPNLFGQACSGADLVVLVKPQFEAGRDEASKGRGVIRDPAVWRRVLLEVGAAMSSAGAVIIEAMVSPVRGAEGNVEFLYHLRAPISSPQLDGLSLSTLVEMASPELDELVERVVTEALAGATVDGIDGAARYESHTAGSRERG